MTSQYYNTLSLFELLLGFEDARKNFFFMAAIQIGMHYNREEKIKNSTSSI